MRLITTSFVVYDAREMEIHVPFFVGLINII